MVSRRPGRDLRDYARGTQVRLIAGALAILIVVGGGLIWGIFGPQAAVMAGLCVGAGLVPVLLIGLGLAAMEWLAKKGRDG